MIIYDKNGNNHLIRIVLLPNRSISWPLLVQFYVFTCFISFSIATLFSLLGYWLVLPFSGLEMLCLGVALYVTSRKIYRQEVISIEDNIIKVEKGCQHPQQFWAFDRYWAQISIEHQDVDQKKLRIFIGSHGDRVELGAFLNNTEKESLAFELNAGILFRKFLHQTV